MPSRLATRPTKPGARAYVMAASLVAGVAILRVSGVDLTDLRRFCARRGTAHEFALAVSCAVLFGSGVAAMWSIAASAI